MNGESTSRGYGGRGIHVAGAETSANQKHTPSRSGLNPDQDSVRPRPAEHLLNTSNNGRRRTESAPDALLDCLHCGKDLLDLREERATHRPNRRHSRRHTVATEREWSPTKATSLFRSSFTKYRGNEVRHNCEVCELSRCLGGTRRKGGRCGYTRRRSTCRPCHCCGDHNACRDYTEKNVGKTRYAHSRERKDIIRGDERAKINSSNAYPQPFTFDDSSGDDFTGNTASSLQDSGPSVAFGGDSLKCKGDYTEDATYYDDDDDSEIELTNVNENRRRKSSATTLTRRRHNRAAVKHKNKPHGCTGVLNERLSCPADCAQHAQTQKEDIKNNQKRLHHSLSDRAERSQRQSLTSEDDDDNATEPEPVKTNDNTTVGRSDNLLIANLSDMLRHHRLCDVTLRSNGQEVMAHKLALAAFSDTFARTYCEGNTRDVVIDIPDTSVGGIQDVLRFVYSGEIRVNPDNVGNVLAVATFLHIDHIIHMCKQMILSPDVETVTLFSSLAEKYQLIEDLTYFYDFICKHFLYVSRTRGWKTLTFAQVFDLLSENNLNVERELDVFHAAVAWIEADRGSRLTLTADLISCVRFAYISPDEIAKHVESKQFLFQGDEGKELLLCIYRHHALHTCGCQQGQKGHHLPRRHYVPLEALPGSQDQSNSAHNPRHWLVLPSASRAAHSKAFSHSTPLTSDAILAVGGVNPFQPEVEEQSRQVAQFHPHQNRWSALTRLPEGRHHHGAVMLGGFLYIIGGSIQDDLNPDHLCNPTASCYRYDLTVKQWSAIAPLNVPRMYHATAVLNDVIFVMAGQTQQSRHLSTMECYRPEVGEWETGVEMGEGRIGVAVAPYRGRLYAAGGFLETGQEHVVRATVEVFDPRTYSWAGLKPLPSPRCHAGLVECGGGLYLVGGSTFPADSASVCSLPSILRYHHHEDRWDRIQTLRSPRHDMGVTVLGCRIFVIGGVSSVENKVLSDVECYDVETDYWLDDVEPIGSPALGLVCLPLVADQ
ncbi:hypothetical protein ACOMHN_028105 [Nucella lapillus]